MKAWVAALGLFALSCGTPASPVPGVSGGHRGEPLDFAFGVLDGSVITGENTRGRATALLFVTTFDLPSQAAARMLGAVHRVHVPRFNACAIVLESAESSVLADVFRRSLDLPFPVAIADSVELRSSAHFFDIDRVPTLVLLDREGREVVRHAGLFEDQELRAWMARAER